MEKMRMESLDMTAQNIEKIGALFPSCITETVDENGKPKKAINFDLLKQMLSGDVIEGSEAYEFTWVGKKAAIVEANKPIRKTLRPCKEESVNWDTTENLYIEGDNLEVLKLLQESYLGAVKMIYIDPPYNTGNDFIYRDDFAVGSEQWVVDSGQCDDEGNRMFKNTDSNGRFHSDWCSMMYSRLTTARNFLRDDGIIFISIHDVEYANLKMICDEVFGYRHYLGTIVWKARVKPVNIGEAKYRPQKETEYVLVYEKEGVGNKFFPLITGSVRSYPYTLNGRPYRLATILKSNRGANHRTTMSFEINGFSPAEGQRWQAGESEIKRLFADGYIEFKDGTPFRRYFEDEEGAEHDPFYCFMENEWSSTSEAGKQELNALLGEFHGFDTVKPVTLLRTLVMSCTKSNDIIMDFFSGSATTAHAIMQLNAEREETRKFIMVQYPEACNGMSKIDGNEVDNICSIGKERIRRAGRLISGQLVVGKGQNGGDEDGGSKFQGIADMAKGHGDCKGDLFAGEETSKGRETNHSPLATTNYQLTTNHSPLDTGFRVFKLDDTNMNDVYYSANEYSQDLLSALESNVKADRSDLDLLFGCLLEWGLPLSLPYTSETIEGCTVHTYNDGDLIACFDENIPDSVIKTIAKRQPLRAVFRDSSFADSPSKINVGEVFKLLAPDTRVKVI